MARIFLPNGTFLKLNAAFVPINVPFPIVLDEFIKYRIQEHIKHNRLRDCQNTSTLPLLFRIGHIYIYTKHLTNNCYITKLELRNNVQDLYA